MAFAKFEENRFRIDEEIAENHAILVNLTASIIIVSIPAGSRRKSNIQRVSCLLVSLVPSLVSPVSLSLLQRL